MSEEGLADTRTRIIRAAASVIRTRGVSRLTLNEVADVSGVSKGGLLYHFPSKDALIKGMMSYALAVFDRSVERHCAADHAPGAWLRGYIKASFPEPGTPEYEDSVAASAIIASVSNNPSLLAQYQEALETWIAEQESDQLSLDAARLIRFAADGLWLQEALGLHPLPGDERKRFLDRLIKWTGEVVSQ